MPKKFILKRESAGNYSFKNFYIFLYKDEYPSHWCVGWIDPQWGATALSDHRYLREARAWLKEYNA